MNENRSQSAKRRNLDQGLTTWERDEKKLKTLWVVTVLVFWFSAVFTGVMYYLDDGHLNFILLSITGGMMVLGVVLKFKYQRHLKNR